MAQIEQKSSYRTVIDKTGPQFGNQRGSSAVRGRGRGDRGAKFTQWRGENKPSYRGGDSNRGDSRGGRGRGRASYRGGAEDTGHRSTQPGEPIADSYNDPQPPTTSYVKRGDRGRGGYDQRNQYQSSQARGRGYQGKNYNEQYATQPRPQQENYAANGNNPENEENPETQPFAVVKQSSGEFREAPYKNQYVTRQKRGGFNSDKPSWDNGARQSGHNGDGVIYQSSRGRGRGGAARDSFTNGNSEHHTSQHASDNSGEPTGFADRGRGRGGRGGARDTTFFAGPQNEESEATHPLLNGGENSGEQNADKGFPNTTHNDRGRGRGGRGGAREAFNSGVQNDYEATKPMSSESGEPTSDRGRGRGGRGGAREPFNAGHQGEQEVTHPLLSDNSGEAPQAAERGDRGRGGGRGRGGPREPFNAGHQGEVSLPLPGAYQSDGPPADRAHRPKPHYQNNRGGFQEGGYQKPAYQKRVYGQDGGYTDKMGFYIMPDKSFYDPDGFFFGPDGYNKEGGHYDDYNKYHPPRAKAGYPTKRSEGYTQNGESGYQPRQPKPFTSDFDKQKKFGSNYDPNYSRNRDSRPPYQGHKAPRQEADAFLAPVTQSRRGGGAMGHQASLRTENENESVSDAPIISSRGGARGGRGGGRGGHNPSSHHENGHSNHMNGGDMPMPNAQQNRYNEPNQGHQGQPDYPHGHKPEHEEDEGDSIFIRKNNNQENKPEDLGWLEQQISGNTDEGQGPPSHNPAPPQQQREAMPVAGNAWMKQFDKPNIPEKEFVPDQGVPHVQPEDQDQNIQNQVNGNGDEQRLASDILQNNMILEHQKRQLAILQYYQEQQQFAIKQQSMRLTQQQQTDQQNAYIQNMGDQFQNQDGFANGIPNQPMFEDQQQVQEGFNPNHDYTYQNGQNNGNFDDMNQQNDYQNNNEGGYFEEQPNQYYQQNNNQMFQEEYQQNNFNNYGDNYQQDNTDYQDNQEQVQNGYYDQNNNNQDYYQDNQEPEGLMQNLNLEAAAFVPATPSDTNETEGEMNAPENLQ